MTSAASRRRIHFTENPPGVFVVQFVSNALAGQADQLQRMEHVAAGAA